MAGTEVSSLGRIVRKKALDSAVVSGLSALSLVATLVFYRIITHRFSANDTDAFFLALGLLNLVIAPAYNAISSALIPRLVQRTVRPSSDVSTLLGSTIVWVAIASLLATLLIALFAADGFRLFGTLLSPSTVRKVRTDVLVLGPLIMTQAVGAVLAAASQAIGRYWVPALAATFQQLVTVWLVSVTLPVPGAAQLPAAFTLGALTYLLSLLGLWRWRVYPLVLTWRVPPDLATTTRLAVPLLMGSIAQQTALVGLRLFASRLAPGAVTAFDLAYRLALAIVEVSASGALAVALTEWSSAVAGGRRASLESRLRDTLALVLFVILPIPLLAHALREPVVGLWLSGTSGPGVPAMTATAMAILLWGVPLEVSGRLYARVLLAEGRTVVQGWLSVLRMTVTIAFAWLLVHQFGLRGLALSDVLAITVALLGLRHAVGQTHEISSQGSPRRFVKIAVASFACWVAAAAVAEIDGIAALALKCALGGLAGVVAYIVVARLLRTSELQTIASLVDASRRAFRQIQGA